MSGLPQGFITFASALSATALNALWEDALLVLAIALLLRFWPRINAATRYTVWSATLIVAFLLPLATTLAFFATPQSVTAHAARLSLSQSQGLQRHRAVPANAPPANGGVTMPNAAPAAAAPQRERLRFTLPAPLAVAIFVLWLGVAIYALARLAIGLARLEQLKRDALPLPLEYREAMPHWTRANKGARDVRLCVSDDTDVPVAVGLFDSMILVPHSLLEGLSESEIDQICLHELAHLRRGDDWSNGMQRVLIALLAWNPAAQFIGQQLDLEREVACDDWVLSLGGSVRPYARCLTKMAERAAWPRYPVPAPGVFATRKHISLRIERLLGAGRNIATNLALAPAAAAVGTVGALALLITAVAPSVAAPAPTASPIPPAAIPPAVRQKAAEAKVKEIVRYVRIADTPRVIHVPALHVHVPARTIRVPAIDVERPAQTIPIAIPSVAYVDAARLRNEVKKSVGAALSEMKTARQNGRSCSGCDFGAVDWSGRDMRGVNYSGADLSHATLVGTNFAGSNLDGVDFNHANLRNASFRGAHMTGCDFGDADLTGVDFTGARLSGCQFTDARLDGAHLTGAVFADCDLEGVDMSRVDVSRAKFIGTDFSGKQSPP